VVERRVGGVLVRIVLALPEPAPAATYVPVRQIVQKSLERYRRTVGIGVFQCPGNETGDLVQAGQYPAVEDVLAAWRSALGMVWIEWVARRPIIEPRIRSKEGVHVPERDQELPAHFIGAGVAEEQIVFRLLSAVHPAHDVHAHRARGIVKVDGVPGALVHRAAILAINGGIAKVLQEGWPVHKHRAHGQQAVEPVAKLAWERFTDPVCREPFGPVLAILPVRERAERYDARIQPGVADVRYPTHEGTALGAGDLDLINVRPVRRVPVERGPARHGAALEFLFVPDDLVMLAGVARPERQRQPPVPLLGDHPVVHVAEPVQLALQPERWNPPNLPGDVHHVMAQFVHADEPLVHQAKDEFRLAAPADRIAVSIVRHVVEKPLVPEGVEDRLPHILDVPARQPAEPVDKHALLIERSDQWQPVLFPQAKVLGATSRRDVHDAGALGLTHGVP